MTQAVQMPRIVAVTAGEDSDVGKSSFARHLLRPALKARYGSCEYLLIERPDPEGRRVGEGEDGRYTSDQTQDVLTRCAMLRARRKSAVVEVGSGQDDVFISSVEEKKGSESRIDLWVQPIRATQKQDKVIETILKRLALGVAPERLRVVLNFIPAGRTAEDVIARDMPALAVHAARYGYGILRNGVPSSETIRGLRELTAFSLPGIAATDVDDLSAKMESLWAEDTPAAEAQAEELNKVALLAMGAKSVIAAIDAVADELLGKITVGEAVAASAD